MTKGEWLLNLHVDNVEGVVCRVGGATEPIVRQAKELTTDWVALRILVELNIGESDTGDVIEWAVDDTRDTVRTTGVTREYVRDEIVRVVEQANLYIG